MVTLNSGSILTNTGSTYATTTLSANQTYTIDSSLADGKYLLCSNGVAIQDPLALTVTGSGASLPADGSTYTYFYNTADQLIYKYSDGAWSATSYCYPFAEITMSGGVASFTKDSNGNNIIFNGACFVGHHTIIYPNIQMLISNGITSDGKLKGIYKNTNAVTVVDLSSGTRFPYNIVTYAITSIVDRTYLGEYDNFDDLPQNLTNGYFIAYIKNGNYMAYHSASGTAVWTKQMGSYCNLIQYKQSDTTVTDFTIIQPVRTATVEMLDTKQDNLTTITGYDATKTQTLKNVSGTLTWVDD